MYTKAMSSASLEDEKRLLWTDRVNDRERDKA